MLVKPNIASADTLIQKSAKSNAVFNHIENITMPKINITCYYLSNEYFIDVSKKVINKSNKKYIVKINR